MVDYDTRVKALELAIASQNRTDAPNQVVERATAFESYLKNGGTAK